MISSKQRLVTAAAAAAIAAAGPERARLGGSRSSSRPTQSMAFKPGFLRRTARVWFHTYWFGGSVGFVSEGVGVIWCAPGAIDPTGTAGLLDMKTMKYKQCRKLPQIRCFIMVFSPQLVIGVL